jgi:molecular chaperone GrpE
VADPEPTVATSEREAFAPAADELEGPELLDETEGRLRRALADLDNLRKRYEREVARERSEERARVAADWLGIVDDLERALQHAGEADSAIVDGVQAVHEQALALLARLGFPRFEDVGHPFDPLRHEAMATTPSDGEPGTVVAAVRPGYGSVDRILRPAGVVVAASR